MKIVIDIPDEYYKFIKDLQFYHSGRRSGRTIERNVINAIKNGTPYEERPQGEWIIEPHSMIMRCSLCGNEETAKSVGTINADKHFCSNCGAKMIKEAEEC